MIELTVLFGLFVLALPLILVAALAWLVLKVVFKIVLFPIALALFAVKIVGIAILAVFALVIAPVLLTVLAVIAIPLAIVAALVGLGFAAFAIVA